jgi:hypothetical protein
MEIMEREVHTEELGESLIPMDEVKVEFVYTLHE